MQLRVKDQNGQRHVVEAVVRSGVGTYYAMTVPTILSNRAISFVGAPKVNHDEQCKPPKKLTISQPWSIEFS